MRASNHLGRLGASLLVSSFLGALAACGGEAAPAAPAAAPTPIPTSTALPPPVAAGSPESDKVTWKQDATAKNCHTAKAGGDLVAAVSAEANGCVSNMHQVGSPSTGTGAPGNLVTTIPLAAKAGHCYRVFGLAETTVSDFDIAIMDSAGKSCGEDGTDNNDALVREHGSICFKVDDAANVNAAVANGQGKWALEVWSD
jgi:hypothetical protein